MPSQPAWAPRASTAASPRPSPMPPAAITSTSWAASTTAGTSAIAATWPQLIQPTQHGVHVHAANLPARHPVGAGYSVTSCGLRILMDQPTESILPHNPPSRPGDN